MKRPAQIRKLEEALEFILKDSLDYFILLVDLCGSTAFKQKCLDQGFPASTWISRELLFLQRVADFVKESRGVVVKTIGDEVMAIFEPTIPPEAILDCAVEILKGFDTFKPYQKNAKLEAKISLDFGETYNGSITDEAGYDPIGTPVDRCSRLNSITKNSQICFSGDFLDAMLTTSSMEHLKRKYRFKSRTRTLKGLGSTTIHSVVVGAAH